MVKETVQTGTVLTEKVSSPEIEKKGLGMFDWILKSGAKFIKDDIKDEDYVR